jgi:hypothetical protein
MNPEFGGGWSTLTDELEKYRQQFDAIETEAREILAGLSEAQLTWQPDARAWSVGDCLDHLVVTGRHSLAHMADAAAAARTRGVLGAGPFRYGLLERWCVWLMEPPARLKVRAPHAYRPPSRRPGAVVVAEFLQLQCDVRQSLQAVNGLDLAKVRVRNPVSRWITFSLGQEIAITAAHERRHLWQVRRITGHPAFPGRE